MHPTLQMVGQDLFALDSQNYLITVDYFRDYWELDILTDTTSATIAVLTKTRFANFVIPESLWTMAHNLGLNHSYFCKTVGV